MFRKFTSIELFHYVLKSADHAPRHYPAWVDYRAKVKLHGTNAAIGCDGGKIFAQKRTGKINIENDNYGFAAWLEGNKHLLENKLPNCHIYGEWIGPGVQNKVAAAKIPGRCFAIYDIFRDGYHFYKPEDIYDFMETYAGLDLVDLENMDIEIIGWHSAFENELRIPLFDREKCRTIIEEQEKIVQAVDQIDPWILENFGVEGHGEGLVYYPVSDSFYEGAHYKPELTDSPEILRYRAMMGCLGVRDDVFNSLVFKAKGTSHERGKKREGPALQLSPEKIATHNEFVAKFVTEERMNHIAREYCNDDFRMENTGTFLKNFCQDVCRESRVELEANGIEWNEVQKSVQRAAARWFTMKAKAI